MPGYQAHEEEIIRYTGDTRADIRFYDGALPHVMGSWNYQVVRANRNHPELADGFGYTYNHAAMLCRWKGKFYLEYLSDKVSEHLPPSHTLLAASEDGVRWGRPVVVFEAFVLPEGVYTGPGRELLKPGDTAITHQRMGFYVSKAGRLYALAFYGVSPEVHCSPNNGYGIARVIREIHEDGSFSPVYVLRYNEYGGFGPKDIPFPFYETCPDEGMLADCRELLADRLVTRQFWEEERFDNAFFRQPGAQAFCCYTLEDGTVIGMYKNAKAQESRDGGETWSDFCTCHSIETSTGKMWGEKTSDGKYALVYNPSADSMHRWPLAAAVSADGREFTHMAALTPYVPPTRYEGWAKNMGPQYVRGIFEGYPRPEDGNLWLCYSMNKEDIWVCRARVPLESRETNDVTAPLAEDIGNWGIYSPQWAPVMLEDGILSIRDFDPYDKAIAERAIPVANSVELEAELAVLREGGAALYLDLCADNGSVAARLCFRCGVIKPKGNGVYHAPAVYLPGQRYRIRITTDLYRCCYALQVEDDRGGLVLEGKYRFNASVSEISRAVFSTKDVVNTYDLESNGKDGSMPDLPGAGEMAEPFQAALYSFQAWIKK